MTRALRALAPGPMPVPAEQTAPRRQHTHTRPGTGDDAARLFLLDASPADPAVLGGAWWPRSRDLARELAVLVAQLRGSGIRMTRVTYHPRSWEPAPHRLHGDGRVIRLGGFDSIDPHLLSLTDAYGHNRLDLLVVPPGTAAAAAARAIAAATTRGNRATPTEVLRSVGAPARPADPTRYAEWETDGGLVVDS